MLRALNARRQTGVPLALGVLAFALAFAQRPGLATADTKINLHVDPGRFLADVASMWTSTGQLGAVQAGQQAGYLFPMGPFFALGHAVGLSDWVVQRLWLGSLLALAAWGVVRLLDALLPGDRGVAHLVAGGVTVLNPFVVTYANRTTVTLLAYAALPWLLLAVHRGLRDGRSWRWPAAFALLVTASGGGVNGAVTAWMLLGPALLLVYELLFGAVAWRAARAFLVPVVPLTVLVSAWWIVPAYVQSSYGINFLQFTEQPGTVWGTTSITESLRLMSFWLSYVGIGFAGRAIPYFDDSQTLLFSVPVVLATLLLPAAALSGFVWTRRWRYGPFFLLLALVAVLVMGAGFPDSTPLRHGLYFTYDHFAFVRFLRASYKAAPLLAVALACLGGVAAGEAWRRLGGGRSRPAAGSSAGSLAGSSAGSSAGRGVLVARSGLAAAIAVVLGLAAWPLVSGRAQDKQVSYKSVPAAWTEAASDLDRTLPANSRAIVLPGDLFSFYTWGGTVDPILPALSSRPVAERAEVPYSDLRATDLLWTVDSLVHQQRLLPGQLPALLSLLGVRAVVSGTDDDLARSDAPPPADAAAQLSAQPGFATPTRSYGPTQRFTPSGLGPAVALPEVRRYDLPASRGLVRVEAAAQPIVVDGSADALAGLAAFGALPSDRTLQYAGDLSPAQVRSALAAGGQLVISDSNRRRAFVASSLEQNTGPTLTANQGVSSDGIILDPFGRGPDDETVAAYTGVRSVEAPASPQNPQFPEHAAFAAIDGSTQTAWLADPTLGAGRRWLQVDFLHKIDVPYVDLLPYDDEGGSVREVEVAGRQFAVGPGWNRLALGQHRVQSLRVTLTVVSAPAPGAVAGAGGIRELRIPGVHASEQLRLPIDAAAAVRSSDLSPVTLTYLFQRTTGDDPFQRDLAHGSWSAFDVHQPGDAEITLDRVFELPASRSFSASAWVNPLPQTPDDVLDRLAGYRGTVRATSSSRFDGEPRWRASGAFDGDPRTAWIGDWAASGSGSGSGSASAAGSGSGSAAGSGSGSGSAWLQWHSSRAAVRVSTLRLVAPPMPVRRPTVVRIVWPGGDTGPLPVGPSGSVALPRPVSARTFRIEVLAAVVRPGASAAERRAVGIAEVVGLPVMAIPRSRHFSAPCGTVRLRVAGAAVAMSVAGTTSAFATGTPLLAESCGAPLSLAAGTVSLTSQPGPFAVDELRLQSPAPQPSASIAVVAGTVLNPGTSGRGSYDHVQIAVNRPAWLVLGESYNRGWQAWCGGRSLGTPVPVDGYANGWHVGPGCTAVRFAFGPNRLAAAGYIVSGVTGALCLAVVAFGLWWRRRRAGGPDALVGPFTSRPPVPYAPVRAVLAAVISGCVFGFVFGIPAGVVSVPVIAFVLWRGIGARVLTLVAGALLAVVVPVLYLAHPGDQAGGNHYSYATAHITAHWVGVAAVGLLIGALWRTLFLAPARARRAPAAPRPAAAPEA